MHPASPIFFVNLPIGIVTAVLALRLVPRDRGTGLGQGADVAGALLITGAMMLGVFTIVKPASEDGWPAGRTLAFGAVSVALPVMLLMGAGAGLAFPALMTVAMAGATPADAGLASGLVNTTAQVGGTLGLAVLATVSAGRTSTLAARGEGTMAALTGGYHLAFWIAAGLVAVAIAVAGTVLRRGD